MYYQINITDSVVSSRQQAFIREGSQKIETIRERKTDVKQLDPQSRREYVEFLRLRYQSGCMEIDCEAVAERILEALVKTPTVGSLRTDRTSFGLPA